MMKLKNIFKKESSIVAKANVESLDKSQLEKVIGGVENVVDPTAPPTADPTELAFRPARGCVK